MRNRHSELHLAVLLAGLVVVLTARRLRLPVGTALSLLVGLALVAGSAVLLARSYLGDPRPSSSPGGPAVSGWAKRSQLARLLVARPERARVVLGRLGARLVAAEASHSLLVVGPSQSGKTTTLALPALCDWEGPVIATSVKGDLVEGSRARRSLLGEVALFDPTGSTGLPAAGWSPLSSATSWSAARRLAADFSSVGRLDGGLEDAGYWYAAAERLLAPLLRAGHLAGGQMTDVLAWLEDEATEIPLAVLERAGEAEAARSGRSVFGLEERQRSSIYSTAHSLVAAYGDPDVSSSESRLPRIDPGWLYGGESRTLYLSAPTRSQARLRPVFVALVRQVVDAGLELAARSGRLSSPLLVLLDEAANIAPLDDLDQLVATSVGHGITFLTVWQDLAQIEARYGARWATIVNNHRAKVLYPGMSDPRTLELLSSLLGEAEVRERSLTRGEHGAASTSEVRSRAPVAPAGWLRQIPAGRCVLLYGRLPPALLRVRPPAGSTRPFRARWPRFGASSGRGGRC